MKLFFRLKTCILAVVFLLGATLPAWADAISMSDFAILPGETEYVQVSLSNELTYTAFQMDVYLPEGLSIDLSAGNTSFRFSDRLASTHLISANRVSNGSVRMVVYSMSSLPIAGSEGALMEVGIKADSSFNASRTIHIRNIRITDMQVTEHQLAETQATAFLLTETSQTVNDSLVWNGTTYRTSGDYLDTLQTVSGTDSIVLLHLTVANYTVRFLDEDRTVLQSSLVAAGAMPQYTGTVPQKQATAQYTYSFAGWLPQISAATATTDYVAQFDSVVNQYQITFVNFDGTILQTSLVDYGTVPQYDGSEPVRTATEQYSYTFTGWSPALYAVDKDEVYRAQFEETVNTFTVTFVDYDGTVLLTETVEYGQAATAPADPVREGYQFTGWSADFSHVTSDLTVTAQYELLNALDQIELSAPAEKFYRDGHFFIRKQGRTFDSAGKLVE